MRVFVLDKNKKPLNPTHPARARKLLKLGRAKVFKQFPFTIIIQDIEGGEINECQLKIDPGSRTTGLAILQGNRVIWAAELTHRGQQIRDKLTSRRQLRRGRRSRKTRYRKPRFLNRKRPDGWLAPSLMSRVHNILTWVKRLCRICPISGLSQELVRFDTQALQNPEISGAEYQQGELLGYEVREYLLEKWNRKCAYCSAENIPLEVEHIQPKSKGGSNRVSNLTLACHSCNQIKGNQEIKDFLSVKPKILKGILGQAKASLKDAAAVNSTRWKLYEALKITGLPVEVGTGGLTKFNRTRHNLHKTHWLDAACVGKSTPEQLIIKVKNPLLIAAKGHGTRQRCRPDKYGFPKAHAPKAKFFQGFQTGDIVRASVPKGKYAGNYVGRIAIRFRPSFRLSTTGNKPFDVHPKYLQAIHHADGYEYSFN
ncbi:RNA-guided endonuclease IscB [Spirulina sp. 06S082]|uniref:RNA-guided endonuclease IscB n=1 Tax=Spirulina sp. 06S082 TaxID=3110248 RepID=UPI002B21419D|nr:RNA-guided endonuclease IscB [Spirulina sp. 06S082]MEA5470458.1 RNA-guided endonuclease IscB [Spirulina sp. 06S082]